jgi:hypothetical protein
VGTCLLALLDAEWREPADPDLVARLRALAGSS